MVRRKYLQKTKFLCASVLLEKFQFTCSSNTRCTASDFIVYNRIYICLSAIKSTFRKYLSVKSTQLYIMGITFSSNSLKKQGCVNAFCFWMPVWANAAPACLGLSSPDEFLVICDWSCSFCAFWRIFREIIDPVNLKFGGENCFAWTWLFIRALISMPVYPISVSKMSLSFDMKCSQTKYVLYE